jgi:hypothetical protein
MMGRVYPECPGNLEPIRYPSPKTHFEHHFPDAQQGHFVGVEGVGVHEIFATVPTDISSLCIADLVNHPPFSVTGITASFVLVHSLCDYPGTVVCAPYTHSVIGQVWEFTSGDKSAIYVRAALPFDNTVGMPLGIAAKIHVYQR